MFTMLKRASVGMAVLFIGSLPASAANLPEGFSYLREVDPTILQEMRYYGPHNFVGQRVDGYEAGECILTTRAARALSKVQARLRSRNLTLKVYDCYRPARGVAHFVRWARDRSDTVTKKEFYPTIDKSKLFALRYIAKRSKHSRGSTVDLTMVPIPPARQPQYRREQQQPCHQPQSRRYADNSVDMGTGYDCFHTLSHTANPAIKGNARRNRQLLVEEMRRAGFQNYKREWWHFELINEPYRKTHFDFPIKPLAGGTARTVPTPRNRPDRHLRIACPPPSGPVLVHSGPSAGHGIVARLARDAQRLPSRGCEGDMTLKEWHSMDAIARASLRPPWCRIVVPGPTAGEPLAVGWIEGRHLSAQNAQTPVKCE